MRSRSSVASPPSLRAIAVRVDERLARLFDAEIARWQGVDPAIAAPLRALRHLVDAGGKRLRPAFCYWAFVGAGGDPDDPRIIDAGAAFELLHAFALVHDDVMDGSDTRRGAPTTHAEFGREHGAREWRGEARRYGEGVAILVGDLSHVYADMLLGDVGDDAAAVWHELRLELNVGQYLDLLATARADRDRVVAHRIARYKSGKYTVERPLQVGAAMAGRLADLQAQLSAYGDPLGEAFQLRDDVLGAFGDPAVTGKPAGQDLREGKPTPLLAAAVERAHDGHTGLLDRGERANDGHTDLLDRGERAHDGHTDLLDRGERANDGHTDLLDRVGRPGLSDGEVIAVQRLLVDGGALDEIERLIERLTARAIDAIDSADITARARDELVELARFVASRDA